MSVTLGWITFWEVSGVSGRIAEAGRWFQTLVLQLGLSNHMVQPYFMDAFQSLKWAHHPGMFGDTFMGKILVRASKSSPDAPLVWYIYLQTWFFLWINVGKVYQHPGVFGPWKLWSAHICTHWVIPWNSKHNIQLPEIPFPFPGYPCGNLLKWKSVRSWKPPGFRNGGLVDFGGRSGYKVWWLGEQSSAIITINQYESWWTSINHYQLNSA